MNQRDKVRLCAEYLAQCLKGWTKDDLDSLERIWWNGDGWKCTKEYRRLIGETDGDNSKGGGR